MGAWQDEGRLAEDPATGVDHDIVAGNAIKIDVATDFDRFRSGNPHTLVDQLLDLICVFHILKKRYRLALPVHWVYELLSTLVH